MDILKISFFHGKLWLEIFNKKLYCKGRLLKIKPAKVGNFCQRGRGVRGHQSIFPTDLGGFRTLLYFNLDPLNHQIKHYNIFFFLFPLKMSPTKLSQI